MKYRTLFYYYEGELYFPGDGKVNPPGRGFEGNIIYYSEDDGSRAESWRGVKEAHHAASWDVVEIDWSDE